MKSLILAGLVALIPVAALHAAEEPKKADQKFFQGTWATIALEAGGKKEGNDVASKIKTVFKDNTYKQLVGGIEVETGTFTLDPEQSPKAIDMKILTGGDGGKVQPGIYKIEGEILTLCLETPGGTNRPKKFSTTEGLFLMVEMKREKK